MNTKNLNHTNQTNSGYTLTELLVVISIIAVLTTITLPNWNRIDSQLKLTRSAHQLSQDLRRTQELTLASADCPQCSCEIPKGYGIYFDISWSIHKYILFGDCNGDGQYDGIGEKKEEISMEPGIEIESLSSSPLTITFLAPDPITIISPSAPASIEISNDGSSKLISINQFGLVNID